MPRNNATISRQDLVLECWLENPRLTFREIAEKCGISEDTFLRYRQDPDFMEKYHQRCLQRWKQLEALALENLQDKLNEEDWQATKYALDGLNYGGKTAIEVSTPQAITIKIDE